MVLLPDSRRRIIAVLLCAVGAASVLIVAAVILWIKLPHWAPRWVIQNSPFVDPVFRADGGPGLTEEGYDAYGDLFIARIEAWGSTIVPQVKAGLSSSDLRARRAAMVACNILAQRGDIQLDAELSSLLITLLADEAPGIRKSSAYCLGQLKHSMAVEALISRLSTEPRADVAESMCVALGRLGDRRALEVLDRIVSGIPQIDEQNSLIVRALETCVVIDPPGSVVRLIKALGHQSAIVRLSATIILGKMKAGEAIQALTGRLEDPLPRVRQEAMMALAGMKNAQVIEPILSGVRAWLHDTGLESDIGTGIENLPFEHTPDEVIQAIDSQPFSPEQRERWNVIKGEWQAGVGR